MTEDHLCATVSVRGVLTDPHGQLLVMQRSSDRQWELPGGRLAPDEPPIHGLKRELIEETGISVAVETILCADSWINDRTQDRFAVYYTCNCETPGEAVTLSEEHVDFRGYHHPLLRRSCVRNIWLLYVQVLMIPLTSRVILMLRCLRSQHSRLVLMNSRLRG